MESLFKKFIYTGIGLVSITKERLQKNIDELVSNQKLSKEEGKKIVDDVMEKTESKRGELESQFRKISEEVMERFNFATSKEMEALKRRVEALEIRLDKMKTPETNPQAFVSTPDPIAPNKEKDVDEISKEKIPPVNKNKPSDLE